jgi:DnaJ-class molecular chaperone
MNEPCLKCGGTGKKKLVTNKNEVCRCNRNRFCVLCKGTGYKQTTKMDTSPCDFCHGSGKIYRHVPQNIQNVQNVQNMSNSNQRTTTTTSSTYKPSVPLRRVGGCSSCGSRR